MSRLKVGIIGGGFMARTHHGAARTAGADVVGLVSSTPARTREAAAALGVAPAHGIDELIERADVIHVCTPNALHPAQAEQVIDAGRHVVCEKPLALDVSQARHLHARAEAAQVVATIPFVYRFHPMVRHARAHVALGNLGRLLTVRGAYLQDWMQGHDTYNWRVAPESGGPSRAFGDVGSHLVDLLEFISGERIHRLSARTSIAYEERGGHEVTTEDAAALTVEMASGAIGNLMVSQVNTGRKNQLTLELAGTRSGVFFDQEHPDELWVGTTEATRTIAREAHHLHPDAARLSRVPAGHPMGYLDAFSAFVSDAYARILGEHPDGLPTFADGVRTNQLIDAVVESSRTRQWVDTPFHHYDTPPTATPRRPDNG